jgi:methionyl-tRNA formyltransferase
VNLVFLGSGAFGLPTLIALSRTHTLRAIISQPDRPAGRGGALTPTPVSAFAPRLLPTIPLHKPERINDAAAQIRAYNADAWVVIAFGQKLGPALLDGVFAINLHASLLPRWRGAAPINAAILAGDARTGNSVITLAQRMDSGQILAQSECPIDPPTPPASSTTTSRPTAPL